MKETEELYDRSEQCLGPAAARIKKFLGMRERAASEVQDYLRRKFGFSTEQSTVAVQYLEEIDLIDDRRFAVLRAEYRLNRGYGPYYLKQELSRLRIAREISDDVAADAEEDFQQSALDLLEKTLPSVMALDDALERLKKRLFSRGFTSNQIRRALQDLQQRYPHWSARKPVLD